MKSNLYYLLFVIIFSNNVAGQIINPYYRFIEEINKEELFNNQSLNILFANKVGTTFGGTSDLSLQKYFATLDANDSSLSLGVNFDSRKSDETKKLTLIFSGALKAKAKNKFASFYKNGDFQEDNIGTSFKITYIGNGCVTFDKSDSLRVIKHRNYLKNKYEEKAKKLDEELNKYSHMEAEELKNYIKSINDELFIEMAKDEISYLEKNKLYNLLYDYWFSFDIYTPFGENKYKATNSISNSLSEKSFYAFSATLSANGMILFGKNNSFFLKGKYTLKNNNNIIIDDLKSIPFQTTVNGIENTTIVTDVIDGYITDYKQFLTQTFTIEPAFFILNNTIGFSPSIEFNAGEYKKTNWKLGIPFSFKDKENKPKINFEIQWKEINTFQTNVHLVGISANYQFGNLIN